MLTITPTLNPSQAEVLSHLQLNKRINTLELRELGICSPAQRISELKRKGAIIETELLTTVDSRGRTRQKVAHYTFKGWT